MAENKNDFNETVASLFKGMDSFLSAKTVVGEAVHVNDTIILPLVDVSFGVGAGAFAGDKKNNAGGGMGGKMSPSAVLVIQKMDNMYICAICIDNIIKIRAVYIRRGLLCAECWALLCSGLRLE